MLVGLADKRTAGNLIPFYSKVEGFVVASIVSRLILEVWKTLILHCSPLPLIVSPFVTNPSFRFHRD